MIPPLKNAAFVLDTRLGSQLKADKNRLSLALDPERVELEANRGDNDGPRCLLVVVGSKGVRCYGDLDGDKRVGKAEWSSKSGLAVTAQIVERSGKIFSRESTGILLTSCRSIICACCRNRQAPSTRLCFTIA